MSKFKPGDRIRVARSVDHDDIQSLIGKTGTVVDRPISHGCPGTHVTLDLDGMADPKHELSVQEIELLADEVRVVNETTGGAKGSKPERFSLLPWDVLGKLAEHYDKGSRKYAAHNWRKGYDWSLSIDALGRHLAAFIEGETYDPETGSHHMLAVMFHAAALVYFTDAFPQLDDRRNSKDGSANDADS